MFNFFKKFNNAKQPLVKPAGRIKRKSQPLFVLPKPDLEELYSCSVQKTAEDFQISSVQMSDGSIINIATDSVSELKSARNAYEINQAGQEIIFTYYAKQGFIGFNNCAILAQDWLINKALALPCDDAIAIDYDINLCGEDVSDEDTDLISKLRTKSNDNKFKIKEVCKEFAENKRKFGQALCFPLVENADYSIPFNIDAISPKSYKGMHVIEPVWVEPVLDVEASTDPTSPRFYQPTWFKLPNGKLIHYSWFIFNTYGKISDILKPSYYFGGYPLPQLLYEYVYAAHKTAKEAPMLAQSKRLNYMEGNLNAFLTDDRSLKERLNVLSWLRNNWGWLLIKKDQKLGQIDTTLTDFDAVTMLGYQIVAAISGVQSARLLETSPKGWQSSGSLEDKNYSKTLSAIQRLDYTPILDFHYKLLAKSEYGLDKDFSCIFDEIDTPTAKERAEIREINSRTDATYINAGVISADEVRTVLREDEQSGYNALSGEPIDPDGIDPFEDEAENGGNSNEPNLFSTDDWITVHPNGKENKGQPLYVEKGESKKDAIERKYNKENKKDSTSLAKNVQNYTPFKDGKESNAHFYSDANYNRWSMQLSDDEKNAITEYTGERYKPINEYLRTNKAENIQKVKEEIKQLDNSINKFELSKPITVYRSVAPEIADKIKDTFQDKAFLSTSTDKSFLDSDSGHKDNAILVLNIPKGKGYGAYVNEHSIYKDEEYEFLLKRNSKFKVKSKEKQNGRTIITLDLLEN